MSGFSPEWLALRETYDLRARNARVRDAAVASIIGAPSGIVDLACGTGATLRAIGPLMTGHHDWRLVDNDLSLLARAGASPSPGARVHTVPVDLAHDLEAALDGAVGVVTTTALLDLVSDAWLERLATEIAVRSMSFYAALTFDGRVTFAPAHRADAAMIAAVAEHQCRDKGFGPALGPNAAKAAIARFEALGYRVMQGKADWTLGPEDRAIQTEMLMSWAASARETGRVSLAEIVDWLTERRDTVAAGRSSISVGHIDFFATPTGTR